MDNTEGCLASKSLLYTIDKIGVEPPIPASFACGIPSRSIDNVTTIQLDSGVDRHIHQNLESCFGGDAITNYTITFDEARAQAAGVTVQIVGRTLDLNYLNSTRADASPREFPVFVTALKANGAAIVESTIAINIEFPTNFVPLPELEFPLLAFRQDRTSDIFLFPGTTYSSTLGFNVDLSIATEVRVAFSGDVAQPQPLVWDDNGCANASFGASKFDSIQACITDTKMQLNITAGTATVEQDVFIWVSQSNSTYVDLKWKTTVVGACAANA